MPPPPNYAKLLTVLEQINAVLAVANETGEVILGIDGIIHTIEDVLGLTKADTSAIRVVTDDLSDNLDSSFGPITAQLGTIESKVSNTQWMLTGSLGVPVVVGNYPTLDLRTFLGGVQYYRPNDGQLIEWLQYLVHQVVPADETNLRNLGHVDEPTTLNLPDCWGVQLEMTVAPAGQAPSSQPDAPIYEYLCRASFGRRGFYDHAEMVRHPNQLLIPRSFVPDSIALEPRNGVEFDVTAIMPVGFI